MDPLPPGAVIDIAEILEGDDRAFIVGGQALNLWAELYSERVEELAAYRPFTSKDLDYFGQRNVAERLAEGLGGSLLIPDANDMTFQTAIVRANVAGIDVSIDFLSHVKGVRRGLEAGVVDLVIPYGEGNAAGEVGIRLMHPLHCFQSRVANVVVLKRRDDTATRQLEASPIILREYVGDCLADGEVREAQDTLVALFDFLHTDITGRDAYKHLRNDPLEIFRHFLEDGRFDERWRTFNLKGMIARLERKRTILNRVREALEKLVLLDQI